MSKIVINHLTESHFGGSVFTSGTGGVGGRFGGVFKQVDHVQLVLTKDMTVKRLPLHAYRRAQRLLLQYLKGYKVC